VLQIHCANDGGGVRFANRGSKLGVSGQQKASRRPFLARAVVAALAALVLMGIHTGPRLSAQSPGASSNRPTFDTISVKPSNSVDTRGALQFQPGGRLVATNIPLHPVFALAYNLALSQGRGAIIGAPSWFDSTRYDIEAKANGDPPREQMVLMLQSLLADRFKLSVHHETRQLPVYALVLTKPGRTGPQLKPHSDDAKCTNTPQPDPGPDEAMQAYCGNFRVGTAASGGLREIADAITIDRFAASLAQQVDRPVIDRTGLSGIFDLTLGFAPQGATASAPDPSAPPSIFTALQEQLGLKLEAQTGPVDVVVIDYVEKHSEN